MLTFQPKKQHTNRITDRCSLLTAIRYAPLLSVPLVNSSEVLVHNNSSLENLIYVTMLY